MGLQIVAGRSGCGKSTAVYRKIIEESQKNPKRNFFIIVPDQFTMQTQKDLVMMSDCGGIMNIDVLSLNRLAHRIFAETGGDNRQVLDDTGKNLVLRKIAADLKQQIPVIGGNIDKQGYIHEVKSAISEFMQYGITPEALNNLTEYARPRGALFYKLKDLGVLYTGFLSYIQKKFITTEESMDILAKELYRSKLIQDSVVVFDGFTGFTPIQEKVIGSLLELCKHVVITLTMDSKEESMSEEQNLFFFTGKTLQKLKQLAKEHGVEIESPYFIQEKTVKRFQGKEELSFLEENLFRYPIVRFEGKLEGRISLCSYQDEHAEIRNTCKKIRELILKTNCCYRDIALITGDLPAYESEIEEVFSQYDIPVFIDKTSNILLNPFIEYIKAGLEIILDNFSYDSVFHYLRSGLTGISQEETDILENYVIELGIRGYRMWSRLFAGRSAQMKKKENAVEELEILNDIRERLLVSLEPLLTLCLPKDMSKKTGKIYLVSEMVKQLYAFMVQNEVEEKLHQYELEFENAGDIHMAKEYGQIYGMILELLDQIIELIGDEEMSWKEFKDILEAGFSEIEIGAIPQSVDRIIVGDIERTRLKPVKYLFFLGLNDGYIPRNASKGGIISDIDREFLKESNMELAPSPRQQMYIQKFYLYLNMTKPSEKLYLSFSDMDLEGKALRPSYLVAMLQEMFPDILEHENNMNQISNLYEAKDKLSLLLRKYADGVLSEEEYSFMLQLAVYFAGTNEKENLTQQIENAFIHYEGSALSAQVAAVLYGRTILSSVSRMEQYAKCAYSYFLQYGISLKERMQYGLKDRDIGTIFHGVLELFSNKLKESSYTWLNFPKEEGERMVSEATDEFCMEYTDAMLYETALSRYTMQRMKRILARAVDTISYQLGKGKYKPEAFEMSFEVVEDINDIDVTMNTERKMKLKGKIDRIDTYEDEEHIYVKVVDYKSGNKDFNMASFYKGTQLQLVVYMNEAMKEMAAVHHKKEAVNAALLYYHIHDPLISAEGEMSEESINQKIRQELRTNGLINCDRNVISTLDTSGDKKSDCIPIDYKSDGSFQQSCGAMEEENLKLLSEYAEFRLKKIGAAIVKGEISLNPCTQGKNDACQYCSYKAVCGFDSRIAGYQKLEIAEEEDEILFTRMREDLNQGEKKS